MTAQEIEQLLMKDGWRIHSSKGSHRHYTHPLKSGKVTIPFHPGDLKKGTVASIKRQAGIL